MLRLLASFITLVGFMLISVGVCCCFWCIICNFLRYFFKTDTNHRRSSVPTRRDPHVAPTPACSFQEHFPQLETGNSGDTSIGMNDRQLQHFTPPPNYNTVTAFPLIATQNSLPSYEEVVSQM